MKKHLLKLLLLCCVGILALGMYACVPSTEQYKVEFLVKNGDVYDVYESCMTNGNSRIVPPSDPSMPGHIFKGWYFDEDQWTKEFHVYSFEKDPIKSDVKIYAWFEYNDAHECKKVWTTELDPTCKTEGRKVLKCEIKKCGKVYDTEIIPVSATHSKSGNNKVTVINKPATCLSKGEKVEFEYCKVCDVKLNEKKSSIDIDTNAHDYYSEGKLEFKNDSFCFTTTCGHGCGHQVALTDVKVTERIVTAATCESNGSKQYVASLFGIEFATAEEEVPAFGHKLCGVAINFDTVYSELTHSDLFEYITLIVNDSNCGDEVIGVFECENCGENHEIKVNKPHVGNWVDVKAATCYAPGEQKLSACSACGEANIVRQTLQTENHVDGEMKLTTFDDCESFDVVVPCIHEEDGCVYYKVILEDVEVTSKEIISKSCDTPDVIRYTYKSNGKTLYYDDVIAEGHFLGDVRACTLQSEDGWFNYRLVGMGITVFDNNPLSCNTMTNGMYTCESCKGDILVEVYRPHTGDWNTIEAATCTSSGSAKFDCDFCDYTETKVLEVLEHTYVYELDTVKLEGSNIARFVLVGKCICEAENIISDVTVNVASSRQPTCTEKGEIVYSCTYEGKTYTHTDEIPMISHSLAGIPTAEGSRLDYNQYVLNGDVNIDFDNKYSITCVPYASYATYDLNATYVCSECDATVKVKVYRVHNLTEKVEYGTNSSSPCIISGTKHNECIYSNCGYKSAPEAFNEVNHVIEAELKNNADGTYTVNVKCTVEGCNYSNSYAGLNSVNVEVKVVADCCTYGVVVYSFVYEGTKYDIEANIKKGNHVINGEDFNSLLVDGKLPNGVTEIVVVGSKTYFKCEKCNQLVEVEVE